MAVDLAHTHHLKVHAERTLGFGAQRMMLTPTRR
jgi:hypothetical protein